MSSTLFISDLHLDPARPAVTRALAAFLLSTTHCDALYILGDLFESWIGDDDDAALAQEVAPCCSASAQRARAVHYAGQSGFSAGRRFLQRAGARLLPDPSVIDLYGTPTLLLHGDSLCTADSDYQAFARPRATPVAARDTGTAMTERRALASQLRGMSKEANSNKAEDIMDVTPSRWKKSCVAHGVGN